MHIDVEKFYNIKSTKAISMKSYIDFCTLNIVVIIHIMISTWIYGISKVKHNIENETLQVYKSNYI